MQPIKTLLSELVGLFVDDGSLVVAVLAWVLGGVICLRFHLLDPTSGAVLLAFGIAALLAEYVARTASTCTSG
jgi:hypothetical protein